MRTGILRIYKSKISAWALFLTVVSILFGAGCTDKTNVVGPSNDLLDPSTKPVVISTSPTNGAVGPFAGLYAPGELEYAPNFFVEFNKLMLPTFGQYDVCSECTGFDEPVVYQFGYYGNGILGFYVERLGSEGYYIPASYSVGRRYTFTVDTTLLDANGNHLSVPFTFSFTPEPYFRVTTTYPSNDTISSQYESFEISFNSYIDSKIFPSIHISPPFAGSWYILSTDSTEALFSSTNSFLPSKAFTITVDAGAKNRDGNSLPQSYGFKVYTLPFEITGISPANTLNGEYPLNSNITISFNFPPDTATIIRSLTATPKTSFALIYDNSSQDDIFGTNDFVPNANYTISFATTLHSSDGTSLYTPQSFSFQTQPFEVTSSFPSGTGTERYASIGAYFSGRIDTASFRSALSISPSAAGYFYFYNYGSPYGYSMGSFTPLNELAANTTYTVTISTAMKSIGGYHFAQPDTFSFTTGN
jgi:hypothetical protein